MRVPFSFLALFSHAYRLVLCTHSGSQAPGSHLLTKRTTNMDPLRPLVAASTSSYVRTDLFGIEETLKLEIVTATLSANNPRGELLDRLSVIFSTWVNGDSRLFLVQREEPRGSRSRYSHHQAFYQATNKNMDQKGGAVETTNTW